MVDLTVAPWVASMVVRSERNSADLLDKKKVAVMVGLMADLLVDRLVASSGLKMVDGKVGL
jgi:hypothetical protein